MTSTWFGVFERWFLIAAIGGLAWLIAGLYYTQGSLETYVIGLGLVALGFGLTSWALPRGRWLAAAGLAVVLVGMLLFLGPGLLVLSNAARWGTHIFLLGVAALLFGVVARRTTAGAGLLRGGAAVCCVAGLFWIYADLQGGMAWQPGNLIVMAGLAMVMVRPLR